MKKNKNLMKNKVCFQNSNLTNFWEHVWKLILLKFIKTIVSDPKIISRGLKVHNHEMELIVNKEEETNINHWLIPLLKNSVKNIQKVKIILYLWFQKKFYDVVTMEWEIGSDFL